MKDFSFDLVFNEGFDYVSSQDDLIDSFIDFPVDNNISYVGVLGLGCCFTADKPFNVEWIKSNFVDLLKKDYTGKVSVVIFRDLDEEKDEFFNIKNIII